MPRYEYVFQAHPDALAQGLTVACGCWIREHGDSGGLSKAESAARDTSGVAYGGDDSEASGSRCVLV